MSLIIVFVLLAVVVPCLAIWLFSLLARRKGMGFVFLVVALLCGIGAVVAPDRQGLGLILAVFAGSALIASAIADLRPITTPHASPSKADSADEPAKTME